jgi:RHS repeat-associated protein
MDPRRRCRHRAWRSGRRTGARVSGGGVGEREGRIDSQFAYSYTNEYTGDSTQLVYLRARYYAPQSGRFLTKDIWDGTANTPASYNVWLYVYANPINLTDPTGYSANFNIQDPLTAMQWSLAKQEARRFGIPKELVAGTLAAEIVYDSDIINTIYDVDTAYIGALADIAFILRERTTFNLCYEVLEGYHEYFGLAPWLETLGIGYGFAPGIANMHAGAAVRTEEYINSTYPGQDLMPSLGIDNHPGVRLRTLLTDEGGIRYAAAYLRWYADLRKGTTTDHTNDLSDTDMIIIYTGYRCSLPDCYGSPADFRTAQVPNPNGSPDDFSVFLDLYKKKP